ncbi:MAG: hypothetical protein VB137_03450, partial [Burkholderia sp.]
VLPDARDVFDSSIFGFLRAYITASDRFCIPTVLVAAQRLTLIVTWRTRSEARGTPRKNCGPRFRA